MLGNKSEKIHKELFDPEKLATKTINDFLKEEENNISAGNMGIVSHDLAAYILGVLQKVEHQNSYGEARLLAHHLNYILQALRFYDQGKLVEDSKEKEIKKPAFEVLKQYLE